MTTLPSFFCCSARLRCINPNIALFIILILILSASHTRAETESLCEATSCSKTFGAVSIQFPFSLRNSNQTTRCGYPGFELSCSNNTSTPSQESQPLITLPESGDFVVTSISVEDQFVWINDPDGCLPKRIIRDHGLNLNGSPFRLSDYYMLADFSFFSCPSNITSSTQVGRISCLGSSSVSSGNSSSHVKYSVVAIVSNSPYSTSWTSSCQLITTASVPVEEMPWLFWTGYNNDIPLQWDNPDCRSCETSGGRCGSRGEHDLRVACYGLPPSQGLSRNAKIGITLGIPALLGLLGFPWIFCCKKNSDPQQRQTGNELSTLIIPHPSFVTMGLDGATIERYPKTQLGESRRLPRPNDNTCSICLCEYQPMEMLRTIPECNHYFHANCIDGWLKMNATCPLCRNLPERSTSIPSSLPLSQTSQQLPL